MSIKGIDGQIMLAKVTELTRDTNSQLRKNELMQDYMSIQGKLLEEHREQAVTEREEAQRVAIQREREGSGGSAGSGHHSSAEESTLLSQADLEEELGVDKDRIIDIRV